MGSYEYFRKVETNGNLLIFCQTVYIEYKLKIQSLIGLTPERKLDYFLQK